MSMKIVNLKPEFDSRVSFYGKAKVRVELGRKALFSYGTPVAEVLGAKQVRLFSAYDYSQTTLRHVREFLQQNVSDVDLNKIFNHGKKLAGVFAASPAKALPKAGLDSFYRHHSKTGSAA